MKRMPDTTEPLFMVESDWTPPVITDLPDWTDCAILGLDIETRDTGIQNGLGIGVRFEGSFITGVSFCLDGNISYYLPVGHQNDPDTLDSEKVFAYLIFQASRFTGEVVGANIKYDLDYLADKGVVFPLATIRDIQITAPLINELEYSYSLQAISERLGLDGKQDDLLIRAASDYGVDPKSDMWRVPSRFVGPYAEMDAVLPVQIHREQMSLIKYHNLTDILDLESSLIVPLLNMTRRGVQIDIHKLAWVDNWAKEEEQKAISQIANLTGHKIGMGECGNPSVVVPLLESLDVYTGFTNKGKVRLDRESLEPFTDIPAIPFLLRAKKFNKLSNTYVKGTIDHLTKKNRIHCTFNQMKSDNGGTITGRLSASDTNLQNQPARDPEIAPVWRSIYIPDSEYFCCCDYSQQEPRLLVHYAEITKDKWGKPLRGAKDAGDRYRNDPNTDFHSMMADVTGLPRKQAKNIFLGMCYGMGGGKLCRSLGLPTEIKDGHYGPYEAAGEEGEKMIDQFRINAPFAQAMSYRVKDRAKEAGSIRTLLGRRRNFPTNEKGESLFVHKALNALIQGSAADQTKKAMLELDRAGFALQLQVHDEVDLSIESVAQGMLVKEIMETCVSLKVPSKVDLEIGQNWGNVKEVECE